MCGWLSSSPVFCESCSSVSLCFDLHDVFLGQRRGAPLKCWTRQHGTDTLSYHTRCALRGPEVTGDYFQTPVPHRASARGLQYDGKNLQLFWRHAIPAVPRRNTLLFLSPTVDCRSQAMSCRTRQTSLQERWCTPWRTRAVIVRPFTHKVRAFGERASVNAFGNYSSVGAKSFTFWLWLVSRIFSPAMKLLFVFVTGGHIHRCAVFLSGFRVKMVSTKEAVSWLC